MIENYKNKIKNIFVSYNLVCSNQNIYMKVEVPGDERGYQSIIYFILLDLFSSQLNMVGGMLQSMFKMNLFMLSMIF